MGVRVGNEGCCWCGAVCLPYRRLNINTINPNISTGGAKAVGAAVTLYTLLLANRYSENHLNPIVTAGCDGLLINTTIV